jgi:putative FmdB family regulatory protein
MPTYGYRCDKCGFEFEKVQKFIDEPIKTCPNCKTKGKVKRIVHATSIVFKGSGFYKTDSRKTSSERSSDSKPIEAPKKSEAPKTAATTE